MRGAMALVLMVLSTSALAGSENQIRRDCRFDALRYCTADALRCLKREDEQCRSAVIACMAANKDKLRAACSRHIRGSQ